MEFMAKLFDKTFKKEKNNPGEKIISERLKIKKDLSATLEKLGLKEEEILEVFKIIDEAQDKTEKLKNSLTGTNIDNDPAEITKKTLKEIDEITVKMNSDVKSRVKEILYSR